MHLHESTSFKWLFTCIVYAWCNGTNETFGIYVIDKMHIDSDDETKTRWRHSVYNTNSSHYVLVNPSVSKYEVTMKLHMKIVTNRKHVPKPVNAWNETAQPNNDKKHKLCVCVFVTSWDFDCRQLHVHQAQV